MRNRPTTPEQDQSKAGAIFLASSAIALVIMATIQGEGNLHPCQFFAAFGVGFLVLLARRAYFN